MCAFLRGEWKLARELLERAETDLLNNCTGVAWELATARLMWCVSVYFAGEVAELSRRIPALLAAAEVRGDIYEATDLRIRISHAALLADDHPEKAQWEIMRAVAQWPAQKFYVQHWWSLIAEIEVALYAGQVTRAWDIIDARWPALERSLLLRAQYILIESLQHRARAALAMVETGRAEAGERARFLRVAARDASRIEREQMPWANPLAQLIRAGVSSSNGNTEDAIRRLCIAERDLEAGGMAMYAAAARRRQGELSGASGRHLMDAADSWMASQNIRNAQRMTAMLAPGFVSIS